MMRQKLRAMLVVSAAMTGCESHPKPEGIGFEEARAMFASRGVQPGQPLPRLSLVTLDGQPADLQEIQGDRALVLVTASLTCNVARRRQPQIEELHRRLDESVAMVLIYTIDAHPKGDACPYVGYEWVPKANVVDEVLVRQPLDLPARLALARNYQQRLSVSTPILVDTMDNASWDALGRAPNLGLLIDRGGVVRLRQGWFDAKDMEEALRASRLITGLTSSSLDARELPHSTSGPKVSTSQN